MNIDSIDILEIDWEKIWQKSLKENIEKEKNWDTIAKDYGKWLENDDYPETVLREMRLTEEDSVLDIGCAEGTLSRKIAKIARKVTAVDKSKLMLEELNKKSKLENITNITTLEKNISDISYEEFGDYDIIIASRCLNGIYNIKDILKTLNKIANKYVYITLFGSSNNQYKIEKAKIAGKEYKPGQDYIILHHILKSIGIEANIVQLECNNLKEYDSYDEAIQRSIWKVGDIEDNKKEALKKYFKEIFTKNEKGNWVNPKDKSDWVLIWWKVKN